MSVSQALVLERFLEGRGPAKKPDGLLSGLGARLCRASELPAPGQGRGLQPTAVPELDSLLAGGLPKGGLVELSGRRSSGRFSIGMATLASATSEGRAAALVDLGGHLDPQAAEDAGVELERLLWVRPVRVKEAVAAAEMLLATGFPLVVVDLGLPPMRGSRFVPDAAWVRLTRTAQAHGSSLLLLTPYRMSGVAAEAVVSAGRASACWRGSPSSRLLAGLSSPLTLEKHPRVRPGVVETLSVFTFPATGDRRLALGARRGTTRLRGSA
jgi:hypothetical protein